MRVDPADPPGVQPLETKPAEDPSLMAALQDEQPPFDRAVCDAMVASTPDTWNLILLTLVRPTGATEIGQLEHSIISPEGYPPVTPDDSLYEATYRLDELFHQHGALFRQAEYVVELFPDRWQYRASFEYDNPADG